MTATTAARADVRALADAEQRAQTLATLPTEVITGMDRLSDLLEALAEEPARPLAELAAAVQEIDEAAQPRLRRLLRDHLAGQVLQGAPSAAWTSATRFLALDGAALAALIDAPERGARGVSLLKPLLPGLALRTVRAAAQLVKWQAMQYGPADVVPWRRAAFAYALAERLNVVAQTLRPYPHIPYESTVREEFVRMAAFAATSPGSLPVAHIEALDRVLGLVVPRLSIETTPLAGTHYWIDLAGAKAPARYVRALDARPGLRFVGGLGILPNLADLTAAARRDPDLPASLGLEGVCDSHDLLAVLAHITAHWGAKVPVRRHPHRPMRSPIAVVRGFDDVLDVLVARDAGATGHTVRMPTATHWITENVSPGGLAAIAPFEVAAGLRVGELLAIRAESGTGARQGTGATHGTRASQDWRIGMVRRLERIPERGLFVAVEMLQGRASAVEVVVEARGGQASGAEVAILAIADAATTADTRGSTAAAAGVDADEAFLALRSGVHAPSHRYVPEELYRGTRLQPEGMARRGADYELLRCRVTTR